MIGNECLFVQSGGNVIRNLSYQLQADSFVGVDLNVLARHLFDNYTITKIAYQQTPNSILWCLRSDGTLLTLTYMQEQEVIAWAKHETEGVVDSFCVIPYEGYDEVWMCVSRDNGRFIERLTQRMVANSNGDVVMEDQVFMDSAISFDAGESITGLDHLNGHLVSILEGGIVKPQQVVESGSISITMSSNTVHIGLPYYSDLETLNIELGSDTGPTQGNKVKVGNITFKVTQTKGGLVGPDEENLYDAFTPIINKSLSSNITYYDDEVEYDSMYLTYEGNLSANYLFSGDIRVPTGSKYDNGGKIYFRQEDPIPVTINAIISEVSIGEPSN